MKDVIARFAPSPTGFLHIGGVRTALINYIVVQQSKKINNKSKLYLRIEDTDQTRSKEIYTKSIYNGLRWLGIDWDEEFTQSEKATRHREVALELLKNGYAYKCICTKDELEKRRQYNQKNKINNKRLCKKCEKDSNIQSLKENFCIRLKIPNNEKISIHDLIQGKVTISTNEIENFILLRKDNTPTYMLSSVVDDKDTNINTVIRGDDHLNNTFKQIQIYKNMEWTIPSYAHLPLIHGDDGSKLSKRHGAVDINDFQNRGYLPHSIINNLILLGWSPRNKDEIIDINQIIKLFNLRDISKSSSIFDYNKLNHFNKYYLNKKENYKFFINYIRKNEIMNNFYNKDKKKIEIIYETYKDKINNYDDLIEISKIYYDENFITEKNIILDQEFNIILKEFIKNLEELEKWSITEIEKCINTFILNKKIKFNKFGQPIRVVLTNSKNGPSVSNIFNILGKKNTFLRLNKYIHNI